MILSVCFVYYCVSFHVFFLFFFVWTVLKISKLLNMFSRLNKGFLVLVLVLHLPASIAYLPSTILSYITTPGQHSLSAKYHNTFARYHITPPSQHNTSARYHITPPSQHHISAGTLLHLPASITHLPVPYYTSQPASHICQYLITPPR